MKNVINKHHEKKNKEKNQFLLPWWCKIIALVGSFSIIAVSLVFIIFKGITLGDNEVRRWLTSFVTQVFTATFLQQPIKIVLTIVVMAVLCRKSKDNVDLEHQAGDAQELFDIKRQMITCQHLKKYRVIVY